MTVRHYHADNGWFADNAFMADVAKKGQTISFWGVNAHFQNGKAERRIRMLQDLARCQLLHAKARWPWAISMSLWPYAGSNAADCINDVPATVKQLLRIKSFTNIRVRPNLKEHHHIGTPVYVLDDDLQSGKKISKWKDRARIGIYLGKSPRHARTVALMLNPPITKMVLPMYQCQQDMFRITFRQLLVLIPQ